MKKYCALALLLCLALSSCRAATEPSPSPSAEPDAPSPPVVLEQPVPATPSPTPGEVYAPDLPIEEAYWRQEYQADDGALLLRVSYAWPNLPEDFPASIRAHYDDRRAEAERTAENLLAQAREQRERRLQEGSDFIPYDWEESYSVERNDGTYLSVLFEGSSYTGGAHGDDTARTDTFRLDVARRLTLDDLFSTDRAVYVERLSALVYEKIAENAEDYYPDCEQLVADLFPVDCFCLTDDGLALFYQPYQLAPYTQGVRRFDLPLEAYEDIWKG